MSGDASSIDNGLPEPLPLSFRVRLEMKSDWHIGSGTGRPGEVDRLARRDADDLPFVPAKTLTGIWRDACERVAFGLDAGDLSGPWSLWVIYLFGDQPALADRKGERGGEGEKKEWHKPHPSILSMRAARLPEDLRLALRDKPAAREAVTFIKPGVSINPRTGRARAKHLRFEEMARAGAMLTATCEFLCELDKDERRAASALLIAGARMVERLGGKRRRGAGLCELIVEGHEDLEPWIEWIERNRQPPPLPDMKPGSSVSNQTNALSAATGEWFGVELALTAELPIIIPSRAIGNLIETLDYIPGTYLLPRVTAVMEEAGVAPRPAIMRGDILITNAAIEVGGEPGRPAPFCLFYEKAEGGLKEGGTVYNRFREEEPEGANLKGHRSGYVGIASEGRVPAYATVASQVETHNVVDDPVQRPTEEVGGVYSYEAIVKGTRFRAELRLRESIKKELSEKDPKWTDRLKGELKIGRASKGDYGLMRLEVVSELREIAVREEDSGDAAAGEEAESQDSATVATDADIDSSEASKAASELTVWLLSDLLLRDERLRPVASIEHLGKALEQKLDGAKLTLRESGELMNIASGLRRMDSWQVGWGLPRPSLVGLAAGTCAVFKVAGKIAPAILSGIEASGLGERRAEGYGQIRFNDPLLKSKLTGSNPEEVAQKNPTREKFLVPRNSSFEYARLIEREAARKEIARLATGLAAIKENREEALGITVERKEGKQAAKSKPRMSQLGALRSVIGRLQKEEDRQAVEELLEGFNKSRSKDKGWQEGSLEKVEALIKDTERVWKLLDVDFSRFAITEAGEAALKKELWAEATRALVDAYVRAHKRHLEYLESPPDAEKKETSDG